MFRKSLLILTAAFALATVLRGSDLRVIYSNAKFIIDKDEILYVEAKPLPKGFIPDSPIPPELINKPLLADIHFKNGVILHVTVASMEELARQLK